MTERASDEPRRITRALIARTVRKMLVERAPKSICPSEVARALNAEEWRPLMSRVRAVAGEMAQQKELVITQRGKVVDVEIARGPIRLTGSAERVSYADAYRGIDFRAHPELYRIGKGEQGVLVAEPYKSELLPLWRFRTEAMARVSSGALWKAFVAYRRARDLVGMDMARKFIQMGYTRARRYARHASGRKYDESGVELPEAVDREKEAAAAVFLTVWQRALADRTYRAMREKFERTCETLAHPAAPAQLTEKRATSRRGGKS